MSQSHVTDVPSDGKASCETLVETTSLSWRRGLNNMFERVCVCVCVCVSVCVSEGECACECIARC